MIRRARARRGVVLIWFAGMFLATAGFTGALAVDYGKVLLIRSQVELVTQDASVAAARAYRVAGINDGDLLLDDAANGQVDTIVDGIVSSAVNSGQLKHAVNLAWSWDVTQGANPDQYSGQWWCTSAMNPSCPVTPQPPPRVTVTITYQIGDLLMMDLFEATTPDGTKTSMTGKSTASAVICIPGQNPDTFKGTCTRSAS
jgi:hypothetical protein